MIIEQFVRQHGKLIFSIATILVLLLFMTYIAIDSLSAQSTKQGEVYPSSGHQTVNPLIYQDFTLSDDASVAYPNEILTPAETSKLLTGKYGNQIPVDCAGENLDWNPLNDDYILLYEDPSWSHHSLEYTRYDSNRLSHEQLENGHGGLGAGFSLFADGTYHICVSIWRAEPSLLFANIGLVNLRPVLSPEFTSVNVSSPNLIKFSWSFPSEGEADQFVINTSPSSALNGYRIAGTTRDLSTSQLECARDYVVSIRAVREFDGTEYYSYSDTRTLKTNACADGTDPAPIDPQPGNYCTIGSSTPGIILYQDRDYKGRCSHLASDHTTLGQLSVGDNTVSSIRINGDYQVRLYEFAYYGGRYVEVNSSNPNLDVTPLGEQFSSITAKAQVGCGDENAQGVFLYSDRNYEGACIHLVTSEADLGKTAVGDDDVSSVRINGEYRVHLFEHKDHKGLSEEVNDDDPDLDKRSLGSQFSSVQIKTFQHCSNTSQPGIYLYSERNYSGNCAYLTDSEPDLDNTSIENDGLRSVRVVGSLYVRMYKDKNFEGIYEEAGKDDPDLTRRSLGDQLSSVRVLRKNTAPYTPTPLYPTNGAELTDGQMPILCWQTNGDPEGDAASFQVRLHTETQEWFSDWSAATCWTPANLGISQGSFAWEVRARDDHYESKISNWSATFAFTVKPSPLTVIEPLMLNPQRPVVGETVVAGFSVKNTSGGVLTLRRLGVGVHGPGCTAWECDNSVDFPWAENVVLQPDEVYVYTGFRSFGVADENYLVLAHSQDSNEQWQHHGAMASMAVSPGIEIVQQPTLSPTLPVVGEIVTATYSIQNNSDRTIVLPRIGIIARGPNCTDWDCDSGWNDFSYIENLSIDPGAVYTYTATRIFGEAGDGFIADSAFADLNGGWYAVPNGTRLQFQVKHALTFVEALTLSPESPLAGQPVTVRFTIQNTSGRELSMRRLGAPVRGPNCADWTCTFGHDFDWIDSLTLQPERSFTYSSTRTFVHPGSGWFVQAVYQNGNDWWQDIEGAERTGFTVKPGLQIQTGLTLSPPQPAAGEPVTARFSIANIGDQRISIAGLMASGRGPNCTDWDCDRGIDFPQIDPLELSPGEEYVYAVERIFPQPGIGYFLEPVFRDSTGLWRSMSGGSLLDFSVTPGLELIEPLVLSPQDPQVGQIVTAEFTLRNNANRAITLPRVGVIARGPNCSKWECDGGWADFPVHESVRIEPGQSYIYSDSRAFDKPGSQYFADAAYADSNPNPWWYEVQGNQRVDFTVLNPGAAAIVRAGGSQVTAGEPVTIPISLTNLPAGTSLGSASIKLYFDPAFIEPLECVADPEDRFDLVECNIGQAGVIRISALAAQGLSGDLRFADIVFATKAAASNLLLDIALHTLTTQGGTPIPVSDQDGVLNINTFMRGDVSCDDATGVVDALFILQHDVGMRQSAQQCPLPENTLLLPACDVNGDGACTVVDAMFVLQCDVGIANSFCPTPTASDVQSTNVDTTGSSSNGAVVLGAGPIEERDGGRSVIPIVANVSSEPVAAMSIEIRYPTEEMKIVECSPDPNGLFALAECNVQTRATDNYGVITLGLVDTDGASGAFTLAQIVAEIEPDSVIVLEGHNKGITDHVGNSPVTVLEFSEALTSSKNVYLPMLIR